MTQLAPHYSRVGARHDDLKIDKLERLMPK